MRSGKWPPSVAKLRVPSSPWLRRPTVLAHCLPLLLRWTKSSGWTVSLKLPASTGAIGVDVGHKSVAVTDGGQTVFALGTRLYKVRRAA